MNLKKGDKVKFLDDIGGGVITEIIDQNTAKVKTDDDFEYPYPIKSLLKVEEQTTSDSFFEVAPQAVEKSDTSKNQLSLDSDEAQVVKDNEEVNIYLTFVPQNASKPTQSSQQVLLINDSNWHIMYVYQVRKDNTFVSYPGVLQPNYIENITTLDLTEINEIKEIAVQLIFFRKIPYDLKEPLLRTINFKPEHFYNQKYFIQNEFLDDKAIMYPVIEENPIVEAMNTFDKKLARKVKIEKEDKNKIMNSPKKFKEKPKDDTLEIDLHIHELLDDTSGMSPKEMLDYQMLKFREELKKAKKIHHIKKVVFIHGKGNGSLRIAIRSFLENEKISYQDASFQKYGFGATLVFV